MTPRRLGPDDRLARPVGVALAGGRSRRMGVDKAELPWARNATLLQWTIERLWRVTGEPVLVAGGDRALLQTGGRFHAVVDAEARGPLAGLLGAAAAAPERSLLVLACDLPLLSDSSLRALTRFSAASSADAVVAWGPDRWQPLCAVYRPSALGILAERARRGEHALYRALRERAVHCERFLGPEGDAAESWHRQLFNVNTPEDLERARRLATQEEGALEPSAD